MKTTASLYRVVIFCAFLSVFCRNQIVQATEISPVFGVGQENFSFSIGGLTETKSELNFQPNMAGVSRIGANAYGFGFGYSFRGSSKDIDPRFGTTKFDDWQLGYHSRNWGIDAFYQNYQGFYTEQTLTPQVFPDLKFTHVGLMARLALENTDFTVSALFDQGEPITTTNGKYYAVFGIRQYKMSTPISLLQQDYVGLNTELENLRSLESDSLNLGVGAGKYWVGDHRFYWGALFDLIGTYGLYKYKMTDRDFSSSYGTLSYNLKIGFGYSGSNWKPGVGVQGDVATLKTPGATFIRPSSVRILAYLRYSF